MRIPIAVLGLVLLLSPSAYGDVRLYGNLVIQDSSVGAVFLGEVVNDTDQAISFVRVNIVARNASGVVIDEPYGYVDGFLDPKYAINSFIPPGHFVPFKFYGDVAADEIASYEVTIEYDTSDKVLPDLSDVTRISGTTIVGDDDGTTFMGEISNNTSSYIYRVDVTICMRDSDGNVIDVDDTYIDGEDYYMPQSLYTNTLIQPGETMPFKLITFNDISKIKQFYSIITYRTGIEGRYEHYGEDLVTVTGEVAMDDVAGYPNYTGEIRNDTDRHLYYAGITFVSRNSDGKIIEIDHSYVDGTHFDISETASTDTHIAPGQSAPFNVLSLIDIEDVATYEYFITYRYADAGVNVEETVPMTFTLDQNYPNPFNPRTAISFKLSESAAVRLDVYNVSGQRVARVLDTHMTAGHHSVNWDAARLPSGVYFYRLSANGQVDRRKMMLVR